jgi:hypothetical protein
MVAPLRMSTRSYTRLQSSQIVDSGAARHISSADALKFLRKKLKQVQDKTLQLFMQKSKRLVG